MTINSVVPARLTVGEVLYINIALQNSAPCYAGWKSGGGGGFRPAAYPSCLNGPMPAGSDHVLYA